MDAAGINLVRQKGYSVRTTWATTDAHWHIKDVDDYRVLLRSSRGKDMWVNRADVIYTGKTKAHLAKMKSQAAAKAERKRASEARKRESRQRRDAAAASLSAYQMGFEAFLRHIDGAIIAGWDDAAQDAIRAATCLSLEQGALDET